MKIELTDSQRALQQEVRDYMANLMTETLREEMKNPDYFEGGGPEFKRLFQQMGEDGWISMSWPKEYGGREATPMEAYIFTEEVMKAGFPYPFLTTEAVGPVAAQFGNDLIQEKIVKRVLNGEIVISIGYSEPDAGTDLASLKTRAVQGDNGKWTINGQKIWTSLGNFADYIWLAARTDPDAAKPHKGISMFMVPTDNPGFSHTPIWTLGVRTNATYYQDLVLDDEWRVGEVNQGWNLITGQLNRERLSLVNHGSVAMLYQEVAEWAAATKGADGELIINHPWVRTNLAKVRNGLQVLRLICWKQAWAMTEGSLGMEQASAAKVYGTEFFVECYRLLMEILGQDATLQLDAPGALLRGKLEHRYRVGSILTFGGGTNEVQREIIAGAGLWMPRSR